MHRSILITIVLAASATLAAAEPSKEACIDAHARGQDAHEHGQLSLARKLFLGCAQRACPALVANDCARFADDLGREQPTISFIARDTSGTDLPDTTVYVDDVLVVTRLDDGTLHDADPGKHVVRFSNGGRDQRVTVVLAAGDKGRTVVATFSAPATAHTPPLIQPAPAATSDHGHRAARLLMLGGGASVVIGAAIAVVGVARMPSACSLSTGHCEAAAGDAAFSHASGAATMVDVGWIAGSLGAAALAAGLVVQLRSNTERSPAVAVQPMLVPGGGGASVVGTF